MSYVSLLKNIPEILSQPTGIAAIASLGIHGAIALIVPLMPVDSKSTKTDSSQAKAVGLMELSPSDQSRLPQIIDPSQVALQTPQLPLQQQLPSGNLSSQSTIMPPLQPPLSSQQVLPPIPQSSANYNLSYLPRRQPVQRFARNDFRTQISNFRVPKSTFSPSASPFVDDLDAKIKETQPLNINRLPQVQADNKFAEPLNNPSPDPIDIGAGTTASGTAQPQQMQLGDNGVQIAANSPSDLAAEQSFPGKGELASAPRRLMPSPETTTRQQPERTNFNQSDSQAQKREELLANLNSYNALRKTIQQEYPNVKEQAVIRETISTDQRGMEGTVVGRLVIDPDGKVLDIKFQDRSVAPQLQSKTREFFSANPPKVFKQTSSYPFQLRFQKNNDSNNTQETTVKIQPSQNQDSQTVSKPEDRKNQSNAQSVVIPNPSPISVGENQPTVSTPSTQKLIQNLRQIKEERQEKSNKEQ
ncbi:energy transducer TonB family protein [Anabaena sp. WFMT]|uniref:energy transducer TonB family protein n=1 Tax=Anabaena sp. WFMT TaxID=3449730 RepID=UPI003F2287EC